MKTVLVAAAVAALFAATPALAVDTAPQGGKPGTSSNPTPSPSKSVGPSGTSTTSGSSGSSTGAIGQSKEIPGASDSKKSDSSLSTEGTKPKQ
jgi:hypothetical protein